MRLRHKNARQSELVVGSAEGSCKALVVDRSMGSPGIMLWDLLAFRNAKHDDHGIPHDYLTDVWGGFVD